MNLLSIFSTFYIKDIPFTPLERVKTYLFPEQYVSKIRFFPQLLSAGTVSTITFEKLEALVFLKTIS